ncbi:MAG: hypothetical protein LBC94_00185, partial [Desulfovibrio sp.]|nr:hypothetical protein [Desulfovibrio sp.]
QRRNRNTKRLRRFAYTRKSIHIEQIKVDLTRCQENCSNPPLPVPPTPRKKTSEIETDLDALLDSMESPFTSSEGEIDDGDEDD